MASDSGMMGGSLSHEFMLLTPVGEDSIVLCNECDFRANMEAAENISDIARDAVSAELEKVHTPDIHTIEDICKFSGMKPAIPVRQLYTRKIRMTPMWSYLSAAILKLMRQNWSTI